MREYEPSKLGEPSRLLWMVVLVLGALGLVAALAVIFTSSSEAFGLMLVGWASVVIATLRRS